MTFGYQYGTENAKKLLQACRDAGVNTFDNAEVYAKGEAETIMVCLFLFLRARCPGLHAD